MKTNEENLTPVYELIPMSEIDIEARKIAVSWVEQYGTMGFDIQNKHKLASDIINYHRTKRDEYAKEVAIDFDKWKRDEEWQLFIYGESHKEKSGWYNSDNINPLTDEELFELYQQSKQQS